MRDKVANYIKRKGLLKGGEHVVIAFSGGPDSICMLTILASLREEMNLKLTAVHVNHHIHVAEADEDEEYVIKICQEYNIPLRLFHEDAPKTAKEWGRGLEETGRELRYMHFEEVLREEGADFIAVGHHKNDLAETMIFFLSRGTGLRGLTPIRGKQGKYLRPLLCLTRKEIMEYVESTGIRYGIDPGNTDLDYCRNQVRWEILPRMERLNAQVVEHMAETAEDVEDALLVLNEQVEKACDRYFLESEKGLLIKEDLRNEPHHYILSEVLMRAMARVSGRKKDIARVHGESLEKLLYGQTGRQINLPYNMVAKRTYEGLLIAINEGNYDTSIEEEEDIEVSLELGVNILPDGAKVILELVDRAEALDMGDNYTKCFDYGIIKDSIVCRHRRQGDRMVINADGREKKLQDIMVNAKMPREDRDRAWIITGGGNIIFVPALRRSELALVTDESKEILKITYEP